MCIRDRAHSLERDSIMYPFYVPRSDGPFDLRDDDVKRHSAFVREAVDRDDDDDKRHRPDDDGFMSTKER